MKILNINDGLSIEETEKFQVLRIELKKNILKNSLKEISDYCNSCLASCDSKNIVVDLDVVEKINEERSYDLFLTFSQMIIRYFTTGNLKFEEKRIGVSGDLYQHSDVPPFLINILLNYVGTIDRLQIRLYRKGKLLFSLIREGD